MTLRPLLDLIAKHESGPAAARAQNVPTDYDVVWSGIKPADRPQGHTGKRLTELTIAEVMDWQAWVRNRARSTAAGRYQIISNTLAGIVRQHGLPTHVLFDAGVQDQLATHLLAGRGLTAFMAGRLSRENFANELAKEWASLPVVTGPNKGRSHYAGDGLNAASCSVDAILAAIDALGATAEPQVAAPAIPEPPAETAPQRAAPGLAGAIVLLGVMLVADAVWLWRRLKR